MKIVSSGFQEIIQKPFAFMQPWTTGDSMQKQPNTCYFRPATSIAVLLALIFFFSQNGLCTDHPTDSITLKSQKKPLEAVLKEIGQANGYTFILADEWKNTPISVNFSQLPMDDALKRILTNMNYAVIYDSATTIRIVIFGISATNRSSHGISGRNPRPEPDVRDIQEEVRMPEPDIAPKNPNDNQSDEQEEENSAPSPSEPSEKPAETPEEQTSQYEKN
jgi:hypothetical protein